MWLHPDLHLSIGFHHALILVILVLSLVSATIKARSLIGTLRSAAQWERGAPTGSAGFHLRSKAAHESLQIAPWHPADRLIWAGSQQAKDEFKLKQSATAGAAGEAADYSDGRERAWRRDVAAERRASIVPDAVALGISVVIATLAFVGAIG
jgi:hypothetical protein